MSDVAVLVQCGSQKADGRTISWQLYTSTLFQKSWTAASMLGHPYVMSAEHGLVHADDRHDTYDESLTDKDETYKRHWGRDVLGSLPRHYDTLVLLGGRDYVLPLQWAVEDRERSFEEIYDPYSVTSGNGQQMRVASRITDARRCGFDVAPSIQKGMEPYENDQ